MSRRFLVVFTIVLMVAGIACKTPPPVIEGQNEPPATAPDQTSPQQPSQSQLAPTATPTPLQSSVPTPTAATTAQQASAPTATPSRTPTPRPISSPTATPRPATTPILMATPTMPPAPAIAPTATPTPAPVEMRLWPTDSDATRSCGYYSGPRQPRIGENSATWFWYGSCGSWKVFDVAPGVAVKLVARGDEGPECPTCALGDINFFVEDLQNGQWVEAVHVDGPRNYSGLHVTQHTPASSKMRIRAVSGFYIEAYVDAAAYNAALELTPASGGTTPSEVRLWPTGADTSVCRDGLGAIYMPIGVTAASWFQYGDCGTWKTYQVEPGTLVRLVARTDAGTHCPACQLESVVYVIEDYYNNLWNGGPFVDATSNPDKEIVIEYTPTGNQIMIRSLSKFYLEVYAIPPS
ncbi:MAG: hypothetical protein L0177_13320 [Chloroflexi bacterium]|nr:hypothetical protein [Chloroflexota bacterium]